jgi:hypothetical protein
MNNKSLLIALLLSLFLNSRGLASNSFYFESKEEHPPKVVLDDFTTYSKDLYAALNEPDLNYEAFETALKGFVKLQLEDKIDNTEYLTVIDMSLSANDHRFFLINLSEKKVEHKSVVAHGRNSGGEFARHFSNKEGSFKTSLGFYRTAETYHGKHGLSLRLDGLESSNSNARDRAIVIHAADYVSQNFIQKFGRLGRSLGCPSLPKEGFNQIVDRIKEGTLLFIYYPEKQYYSNSSIANHDFSKSING